MQKDKIFIVVPDGVGVRNYLYSKAFNNISANLVLFHNLGDETIEYLSNFKNISQDIAIPEYK